jgi:hypothetical protein
LRLGRPLEARVILKTGSPGNSWRQGLSTLQSRWNSCFISLLLVLLDDLFHLVPRC